MRTDPKFTRIGALLAALVAVIWLGLALSTTIHLRQATQLFTWRLAPHADLVLQVLAAVSVVGLLAEPSSTRRYSPAGVAAVMGGLGFLCMYLGVHKQPELLHVLWVLVKAVAVVKIGSILFHRGTPIAWIPRLNRAWQKGGPLVIIASCVALVVDTTNPKETYASVKAHSTLFTRAVSPAEESLYAWMKTTPKNAVFLTRTPSFPPKFSSGSGA
jgi:hypothetical protein